MAEYYLTHWGVKGMKWGVKRAEKKAAKQAAKKMRKPDPEDYHDDYKKAHDNKSVKLMSDKELRERNNRLQMERQYADLNKKKSKGKQAVNAYIATAGLIAGVATATATYSKYGNKALDKIGPKMVRGLNDFVIDNVH